MELPSDLLARAEAGDAEAQCDLGRFYFEQADEPDQAITWFSAAAKQGLPRANHNLGVMAVRIDKLEIAKAYFGAAAAAGWANSEHALGAILREEGAVEPATVLFKSAAQHGNVQALADLASIEMDRETDEGYRNALMLAQDAAAKGVASAYRILFLIYNEGLGVAQDQIAAAGFAKTGANLGDPNSQAIYGVILHTGKFATRDFEEAAFMLSMAAQHDAYVAKAYLPRALDALSAKQLATLNERLLHAGYRHMAPLSGSRFWRVWVKRPLSRIKFHFMVRTGQDTKLADYLDEARRS